MFKSIMVSMVVALAVSSSAWGGIVQGQDFAIGTANAIELLQGQQNSTSTQDLLIDISQDTSGGGLAIASAHVVGITSEIGGALGASGLLATSRLGTSPLLGVGGALIPGAGSVNMALARARLNSLLIQAQ
jgi:hypothetical protein